MLDAGPQRYRCCHRRLCCCCWWWDKVDDAFVYLFNAGATTVCVVALKIQMRCLVATRLCVSRVGFCALGRTKLSANRLAFLSFRSMKTISYLLPPRIVMTVSVCLSVREHKSGITRPILTDFLCMLPSPWLDPPLAALRYVMSFRFCG